MPEAKQQALIPEVEHELDERKALRVMELEDEEGKYRPWDDVKKEMASE